MTPPIIGTVLAAAEVVLLDALGMETDDDAAVEDAGGEEEATVGVGAVSSVVFCCAIASAVVTLKIPVWVTL